MARGRATRMIALGFLGGFATGLLVWSREQHPEEVAQAGQHLRRLGVPPLRDQGGNSVQGIEQEMGLELPPECLEAGPGREALRAEGPLPRREPGLVMADGEVEHAPREESERVVDRAVEQLGQVADPDRAIEQGRGNRLVGEIVGGGPDERTEVGGRHRHRHQRHDPRLPAEHHPVDPAEDE